MKPETFVLFGKNEDTLFFIHFVKNDYMYTNDEICDFFEQFNSSFKIVVYNYYSEFDCFDILVLYPLNQMNDFLQQPFLKEQFYHHISLDRRHSELFTYVITLKYNMGDTYECILSMEKECNIFQILYQGDADMAIRQTVHKIL